MNIKERESDDGEENEEEEDHQTEEENESKRQIKRNAPQTEGHNLVYPPDGAKTQKEEGQIKQQLKSEIKVIKQELKNDSAKKKLLFYKSQKQRKKNIQKLAFPPPEKQIPLSNIKIAGKEEKTGEKIIKQVNDEAKFMIHKMKILYKKDLENFTKGELAYQKVKFLKTLAEKLSNIYLKRLFIDQKGLKQFERWLEPIVNENKEEFEPSLALKLGLIKILREMNLTADQIEKSRNLITIVQRNRQSLAQELRELSFDLIKQWEYNIMNDTTQQNRK